MDRFIGQIALFPYTFAPRGWAECDGRALTKGQNSALFSLIGYAFGGSGEVYFLPDLRGGSAVGFGTLTGGGTYPMGQRGGAEGVSVTENEDPAHGHSLNASSEAGTVNDPAGAVLANAVDSGLEPKYLGLIYNPGAPLEGLPSIAPAGNQNPHNNMQPSLALRYCIALDGIYPQPGS